MVPTINDPHAAAKSPSAVFAAAIYTSMPPGRFLFGSKPQLISGEQAPIIMRYEFAGEVVGLVRK